MRTEWNAIIVGSNIRKMALYYAPYLNTMVLKMQWHAVCRVHYRENGYKCQLTKIGHCVQTRVNFLINTYVEINENT